MVKTFTMRCGQVLVGLLLLVSLILGNGGQAVLAQTGSGGWETPTNLSRSGWTMDPIAAVDLDGGIHVIWQDVTQNNFQYTQTTAKGWRDPVKIAVPFPAQPVEGVAVRSAITLVALSHNRLAALWLVKGELRYSVAFFDKTKLFDNWSAPIVVSTDASAFSLTMDAQNNLHMAFIQSAEAPGFEPGIYYTKLADNVTSWLTPELLYSSPYYRNGPTSTNNSVDIATSTVNDATQVFVAFDNQNRKRVFFDHSTDGGLNWGEVQEMDGPSAEGGQPSPYNVRIHANQQGVMLVWQVSQSTNVCFQNYRYSSNAGGTWSGSQRMPMTNLSCAEQIRFMKGLSGDPILMTVLQDVVYFAAWDGQQWSDALPQTMLSTFQDPDTLVNVNYGTRQVIAQGQERILSVGCEQGSKGDTWLTSLQVKDLSSWFPGKSTWRVPSSVQTVNGSAASVKIAADRQGGLHAIWSQVEEAQFATGETVTRSADHVLYYSKWSSNRWTSPIVALRSSKAGNAAISMAEDPAMVIDSNDQVLVVWRDPAANELFFSWAAASRAEISGEWSKPALVTSVTTLTGKPDLWVDSAGVISLAYSVPINEQRGVYLTQSSDMGAHWSTPVQVFDGAAAGWEVVGVPNILESAGKTMHIFWSRDALADETSSGGVYYAQSVDAGKTWSKAEEVSTNDVTWRQIVSGGNAMVMRAWQEMNNGKSVMLYQVSKDDGKTWSQVERISNTADLTRAVAMAPDVSGHVHLAVLVEDAQKRLVLHDLFWDGSSWLTEKTQDIGGDHTGFNTQISAVITTAGQLAVIGLRPILDLTSGQALTDIFSTDRQVTLLTTAETPAVIPTQVTPSPATTLTPTVRPAGPTATVDLASLTKGGPTESGGTLSGVLIAGGVALLVVVGGVVLKIVLGRAATRR